MFGGIRQCHRSGAEDKSFIFVHFHTFLPDSTAPFCSLQLSGGGAKCDCHVRINRSMMTSRACSVTIATPADRVMLLSSPLAFNTPLIPYQSLLLPPPTATNESVPPPKASTHLWESGCERALTIASIAVSKSSGSRRTLKQSCSRLSLSLRGTSSSTQDDRQRSTRAFTAPGLSVLCNSCCSKGHTDPHSRPRAPRTCGEDDNEAETTSVTCAIFLRVTVIYYMRNK